VAEGNGQSVGRIERLRVVLQVQQAADHHLHLEFVSLAIADDGFLDLQCSVLGNRETMLRGDQQSNPA